MNLPTSCSVIDLARSVIIFTYSCAYSSQATQWPRSGTAPFPGQSLESSRSAFIKVVRASIYLYFLHLAYPYHSILMTRIFIYSLVVMYRHNQCTSWSIVHSSHKIHTLIHLTYSPLSVDLSLFCHRCLFMSLIDWKGFT